MLTGVETAELLTQQAGQHGDDPLHQVHTCGPGLRLFIQRTAQPAPKHSLPSDSRLKGVPLCGTMYRCKIVLNSSDSSGPLHPAHCPACAKKCFAFCFKADRQALALCCKADRQTFALCFETDRQAFAQFNAQMQGHAQQQWRQAEPAKQGSTAFG